MTLDDICALGVGELAADDAVLFMWATSPKLAEAMRVIEAWGFTYRTCAVWVKDKIGMGYYVRQQHELLLIAARGELPVPQPADRVSSVIHADRTEHSAKPEEFYELIEGMYPEYRRIELFSRAPRDGWEGWGNQYANQ
jgi:N6-adenosine-specific RNA methylase IME4